MDEERLLSPDADESDKSLEKSLRPRYLAQYIGQDKVKQELTIYIEAAKNRQEALDHVLLYGPPGLGKTTMAMVIANEMDVQIRSTSGPAIERPGDLVAILNELEPGDVLFIDEIHRLPRVTLVGATTRAGMLSAPLRDRFGIISHMEYYEETDLREIVLRSADIFQTEIVEEGAVEIARRSRGTPRIANRLLKRIRDFAQVQSDGVINQSIADQALRLLQVDEAGLDYVDQKLLKTMIELYHGGPIGLSTLAVNIGEERETVEDMYEPYLIQKGFIKRTPRGRMATPLAYEHFNYPYQA